MSWSVRFRSFKDTGESQKQQHQKTLGVAVVQWADKQESRNSTQPPETLVFISYHVETSLASRQTAHGLDVCVWSNEAESEAAAWAVGIIWKLWSLKQNVAKVCKTIATPWQILFQLFALLSQEDHTVSLAKENLIWLTRLLCSGQSARLWI